MGALRWVSQLAADREQAGLVSAFVVVGGVAFGAPAVVVGILIAAMGLASTR